MIPRSFKLKRKSKRDLRIEATAPAELFKKINLNADWITGKILEKM